MLNLALVGLNHRTAKLELRERAAFPPSDLPDVLRRLAALPGIKEGLVISTCNRVEMVAHAEPDVDASELLTGFLARERRIPRGELEGRTYGLSGRHAVRHLFRVASSLDSLVVGEPQILGQIRSAYGIAVEASSVRTYLNMLLQAAFRTAKRVRTETNIGEYSVSVSSAAVDLARKIFGTLDRCPVLVVGAGEMAELAVRHLVAGGAKTVRVANRSPEAGQRLATEFSGQAVPLSDLAHWVAMSDIVLTSTGSPEILVGRFMAQSVVRRRKYKPIVFIDISVPRNVDPRVSELDNVFCYDIDDLGAVAEANRAERKQEAAEAERIIGQEVEAFCSRAQAQDIGPAIAELQDRIEGICRGELQRYLRKSGPRNEKETRELEWMVSRIAGKIAHPLITQLKASHHDPDKQDACLETIRRMFVGDTPSENGKSA